MAEMFVMCPDCGLKAKLAPGEPPLALRSGNHDARCRSPELTNIGIGRDRQFRWSFLMVTQVGGSMPEGVLACVGIGLMKLRRVAHKAAGVSFQFTAVPSATPAFTLYR